MAVTTKTLEFRTCEICGREPVLHYWGERYSVECLCGLYISGLNTEAQAQYWWNYYANQNEELRLAEQPKVKRKKERKDDASTV